MSDLTDRAEQLLAGITPGPWAWVHDGDVLTSNSGKVLGGVWYNDNSAGIFADDADAAFIAAAPTLVADLLAEVKRLVNEVDERQGEINTIIEHCWHTGIQYDRTVDVDQIDYPIRVIHELRAEVKRLTPREITTVEELEALPPGTILRDANGYAFYRSRVGPIPFPATVLYLPEGGEQ